MQHFQINKSKKTNMNSKSYPHLPAPDTARHMLNCVHSATRVNSPLLVLYEKLLMPQLIKFPAWFTALKLDMSSVKLFIINDAEVELLNLFLDLTHRSFLQFSNYLLHDRLKEYARLREICQFPLCPIIITLNSVQNLVMQFLPIFEYTDISHMDVRFREEAQLRRTMRQKPPTMEIIYQDISMYNWAQKDPSDIESFRVFLNTMFNIPWYTYHTFTTMELTPLNLNQNRTRFLHHSVLPENLYTPLTYQGMKTNIPCPNLFIPVSDNSSAQHQQVTTCANLEERFVAEMPILKPEQPRTNLQSKSPNLNTLASACEQLRTEYNPVFTTAMFHGDSSPVAVNLPQANLQESRTIVTRFPSNNGTEQ
jgi:hypothetical protein